MRLLTSWILSLATVSVATSALGAAGTITTQVLPLTSPVTYSTNSSPPLETYVGYTVNFTNTGGNTINDVRFTFAASATDPAETVALFNPAALPAGCTQTTVSSFACSKRQLRSGESFFSQSIVVFFRAPVKVIGGNGAGDAPGTDFVSVGGQLVYAEGASGGNPRPNSEVSWVGPTVSLGTADPVNVRSALPQSGGKFFTGDRALTVAADPFAASVTVPAAPTYSTAELLESDVTSNMNCTSHGNFHRCFGVDVTIPNITFTPASGSFMTFVLRIDASNIKTGTKIGDVRIQYFDGNNTLDVGTCASATTPKPYGPCIARAVFYKNKSVPGWTPELSGDFEWTLLNLSNGLFTLF
ncbi:MAG TPA: hypothetical protein VNA44_02070 [Burkholderiaceae bacterium]|nr:hypothetical protein [Burkholderiaceae bacterium]